MAIQQHYTISDAEIAGYARAAGFTGGALVKAVAIALAESSGDPASHNTKPPDDSYGLWQINMYGANGPARRKSLGLSSNDQLLEPATNARAAYALSNAGTNFMAWATYFYGDYLAYMPRAAKAAGNPDTTPDTPSVQPIGVVSGLDSVGAFFDFVTDPITWMRFGMVVAGGIMLAIALAALGGQTQQLNQLIGTITDAVPQTKALKNAAKVVT